MAAEDRLAHTLAAAPTCLAGARGETDDKLARTVIVLPDFSKLSEARSVPNDSGCVVGPPVQLDEPVSYIKPPG